MDTGAMQRQLRHLTDRAEITDLVRTADGRRISATAPRIVWTQGPAPRLPTEFAPATAVRRPPGLSGVTSTPRTGPSLTA